jgi:DNA repair exonuclease SbcCD ATPase subunit
MGQKQDQYFEQLFGHLENLESKLSEMDQLMNKVNSLEEKLEKYRPKTPQEKLELRSLDSGPYNQKLTDFFIDKEGDMEKSGKNEYVLTTDDVQNFTPSEIKTSFSPEPKKNFGF